MADNTDEEHFDSEPIPVSENFSDENIPIIEADAINSNPEIINMEVHKHPHHVTHKKKWGEYLLEFLLLFLAVFLGFVAENIRETSVEHDREKEYMVTMLEDLKTDVPLLIKTEKDWEESNNSADSVVDAITFPLATADLRKAYRHINEALNYWGFSINDRTTTQLKNAGGFRLLRNKKVANSIIAYEQLNNINTAMAGQHNSYWETVINLRNKVFVQEIITKIYNKYQYNPVPLSANSWIDSMINKNKIPLQAEAQSALLFEFKNALLSYKQDYIGNMKMGYDDLLKYQQELITLISKEYHLE